MNEFEPHSEVCLNVAVDHRIRALCKPVNVKPRDPSNHVSRIQKHGKSLGRPAEEIQVTAQLAGPAEKGGIAVVLQQPRADHPFEEGVDCVIEDCKTLEALDQVFSVVSCGTLDIRSTVSVVDLLPYISDCVDDVDDADLTEGFSVSMQVIFDKEPDVLICAGQIQLPEDADSSKIKGAAARIQSRGVGKSFGGNGVPKLPVRSRFRRKDGSFVSLRKINGFHPSYAVNYHPYFSLLRQLQMLVCAEACSVLRGDWKSEEWMATLKDRCRKFASLSAGMQPEGIEHFAALCDSTLNRLEEAVLPLLSDFEPATYEALLSSNLSELCNDASLILDHMDNLLTEVRNWPTTPAYSREQRSAINTRRVMHNLLKAADEANNPQLTRIIQRRAASVLACVPHWKLDLDAASNAFLELAIDIETLLSGLWPGNEVKALPEKQEEVPVGRMGNMSLASNE